MTVLLRQSIPDFALENGYYAAASVAVYEVDASFDKTATLATLYAAPTGTARLGNPQTLDSRGKWPQPVYVDRPVVMTITRGADITDSGVISLQPRWRGEWATGQVYYAGDRVSVPSSVNIAVVLETHTSGTYATDLGNGLLEVEIDWSAHTHEAADISDSTAVGRALLTAATVDAQHDALGFTAVGKALAEAASQSDGRSAIGAPALPTGSAGAGNFVEILSDLGSGYTLPAGGTWAYMALQIYNPDGTTRLDPSAAGVAAGGTTIVSGVADHRYWGWAWRIA